VSPGGQQGRLVVQRDRPCTLKPALRTSHSRTQQRRYAPRPRAASSRPRKLLLTQTGFALERSRRPDVPSAASDGCWGCLTGPGHWSLGVTLGGSIVDVPLSTSTVLATRDELFSTNEQLALRGSWLVTAASPARPTHSICASTWPGAPNTGWRCSVPVVPTSSASPATSSPWAEPGPPIARRLCTVACLYRYAEQEGLIAVSPAAHVRRPRLDYESTPPAWIATRSAPCWWPPGWPAVGITR
jgi:hypothetical protein